MNAVKLPFKHGSSSHVALKYASMKRMSVVTVDGIIGVFPNRFEKPSRAVRSFEMLSRYGYVSPIDGGWKITQRGLNVLKESAEPYSGDKGFTRK
jgi:hypothetical protein